MAIRIFGWSVAALGAVYLALALQLPFRTLNGPGAGFFPLMVAGGLILTGAACGLSSAVTQAIQPVSRDAARKVIVVFASLAGFCFLLPRIGYIASGALVMIMVLRQFEASWRLTLPLAVASAVVTYGIFVMLLGLPLPYGSWLP